jgi:enolase-phosphatase E1
MKRQILTDIMGTCVHNDFVKTISRYFAENAVDYLTHAPPNALAIVDTVAAENGLHSREQVVSYIFDQLKLRNLRPDFMAFMGMVDKEGYKAGKLIAPVFDDVPRAFERWQKNNQNVSVYSQGSAQEQVDIFMNTSLGDLTGNISGYFGTDKFGKKDQADSYKRIADAMQSDPRNIRFLSDRLEELDAADSAGYNSILVIRPGNNPVGPNKFRKVTTFDMLLE